MKKHITIFVLAALTVLGSTWIHAGAGAIIGDAVLTFMAKSSTGKVTVFETNIKKSQIKPNTWQIYGLQRDRKGEMQWEKQGYGRLILKEESNGIRFIMLRPLKLTDSTNSRLFAFTMTLKDIQIDEQTLSYPKGFGFEGSTTSVDGVDLIFDNIVQLIRVPEKNMQLVKDF